MPVNRVLHVLGTANFAGTAICQIVEDLAIGLDKEQFRIEACFLRCGEWMERFTSRGIKCTCVDWSGSPGDPIGAARYASLLLLGRFDLIHLHTGGRFLTQMSRAISSGKIVRHVHGRASEKTGVASTEIDLPSSDAVIANSRAVADACTHSNAVVIYPGIRVTDFHPDRALGTNLIVGTACRLEPVKAVPTLIQAIAIVVRNHPSVRLEIAGDGSLHARLEEDVARLGISGNVSFLGWQKNMPSLFSSWSIFVLSSLDEGFGAAVLEAMASGLPVIASDVGGLSELVQDGETGFLVPPGASGEFASKICLLLNDRALRAKMGAAGRSRAQERFSTTAMVRETAELYKNLLEPLKD